MKVFKYLLFLLLILVIGGAIYVAVQPNHFKVTRSRTIKAPSAVIYSNLIDYKNWEAWSPWIEKDPSITLSFPENTRGEGGSYAWEDKDGKGSMTTIATETNTSISQQLQFEDFPPSDIQWHFKPISDDETEVTWTMSGDNLPFGFKMYTAFTGDMEQQVGPDYERGLEKLDSIIVASMKAYSVNIEGITQHGGGYYLYNTTSCKISDFETTMKDMMLKVGEYAMNNNIKIAGAPFVSFLKWDEANNATIFSCCVPTTDRVISSESDILTGQLEPFKALKTTLKGDYENLKEAWDKAMAHIQDNGLEFADNGPMLEVYQTDSKSKPNPADWITEIYIAVK